MAGFALLELLGWVQWHAKPLLWANYLVGGVLFGVGMVLAGGCVSGTLYKAGEGHLNSIVALMGIPIGIGMVEDGLLSALQARLKGSVIKAADGSPVTFAPLTGLPHWALSLIFVAATVGGWLYWRRRKRARTGPASGNLAPGKTEVLLAKNWKPWVAGLLVGILGCFAWLSSAASGRNYPLGVTHGVYHFELLLVEHNLTPIYKAPPASMVAAPAAQVPPAPAGKKVSWWLVALVTSLVAGSWVSARSSGKARLIAKPPEQVVIAFIGGLLVGIGAAIATGCVIGNIISGIALMSVGMVLFTVVAILANWVTTYFYLMGGSLPRSGDRADA